MSRRGEVYRIEVADLPTALLEGEVLGRYAEWLATMRGGLAEQEDIAIGERNQRSISAVQAYGVEALASERPIDFELLLADLIAVASFEGWPLPLSRVGHHPEAAAWPPAGWLGGEVPERGPLVSRLDPDHLILERDRGRSSEARLRPDRFNR